MMNGIDVSFAQGKIDWKKVKDAGVQFAIIRSSWGTAHEDKWFAVNISAAKAAGLPVGIYHYSYALNTGSAQLEAAYFKTKLDAWAPELGGWLDFEEEDQIKLPVSKQYDIIKMFIDMTGAGLYTFKDALEPLRKNYPNIDEIPVWVAQWGAQCTYSGKYKMWQKSNKGRIDGINADVDLDEYYGEVLTAEPENEITILQKEVDILSREKRLQADEIGKLTDELEKVQTIADNRQAVIDKIIAVANTPT